MGRPTDYKPEYVQTAQELCANGATDSRLADEFGVSIATIKNCAARYPEFLAARKTGKEVADEAVELSLYQRALGYEHDEIDIRVVEGQIVETPIRKHYAPDPTAMIFWLKNRKPKEWRDRQELTGADGKELLPALNPQDVAREIAFLLAQAAEKKD